ncbi:MAG: Clp protease N-terminal domain-containing protein, partial [Terriglobales bacterium]
MFERFTEQAIRTIMHAQEEARRLGLGYVGSETILLGLISSEGIAAAALRECSVDLKQARIEAEKIVGRGSGSPKDEIPFTPRAKRNLALACIEADQLHSQTVGPEHLLLGILKEEEGAGARTLENLGVEIDVLRSKVIESIAGNQITPARIEELKHLTKQTGTFMSHWALGFAYEKAGDLDNAIQSYKAASVIPHGGRADQKMLIEA